MGENQRKANIIFRRARNPGNYRLVRLILFPRKIIEQFFLKELSFDPTLSRQLALAPPKSVPASVILWYIVTQRFSKSFVQHKA